MEATGLCRGDVHGWLGHRHLISACARSRAGAHHCLRWSRGPPFRRTPAGNHSVCMRVRVLPGVRCRQRPGVPQPASARFHPRGILCRAGGHTGRGAGSCAGISRALGREETAALGILSLAPPGRHVQIRLFSKDPVVPMGAVVGKELVILGSHGMPARDYHGLLALVESSAACPVHSWPWPGTAPKAE